ncbi:phosphatidate cytidylyltransferase [Aggregatibacter actinomycetemcomitans]|uniref:Phosphatidate cytidylyltransferase n=2 Tax=Aggregatibacter actinomycetemcomitans TaxID=714 RepID=A0A5D0EII3_AGGAC|nr:phosphatidate cytidylyltransferase [Aggregatibacter actinomycetemcomitans]AFI86712.1 phosphatidate cytidylyltransferase [Aggregatibacter actinomycetemcomitans D7S-1]KYK96937.1 phosphatidate cytidylyltransferase [Aggregatibacter actinomycetemcomitans serotype d str. SA3733]AMQ93860.1 phosphatidate cytidylyltransferase [Aggregatibacter actinomycetemcomitans]ANU81973.1 phosphatidate cytidylyltransferase [Aggregatibacter actinomycetemcomitans]EKX96199.1 phosphatidate cytidylyltransferase [Aggre
MEMWKLFGGLMITLIIASSIGYGLKLKVGWSTPHVVIDNLNARINAWWVMILIIFAAAALGFYGIIFLFFVISFMALREFLSLLYIRRGDHLALAACFYVILPVQYILVAIDWFSMFTIFIPVYGFLFLPILSALLGDTAHFLDRSTKVQWALMISVFCISHIPAMLTLDIAGFEGKNLLLMIFLILVVQASDVLQYVWGKLFGKHKIAPRLSPSKTVEGFVGGVVSASVLGGLLYWLTPFSPVQAVLMSLLICLMGFLGGLVMSAMKRSMGVKDWGNMISGHGGMLDRMDSLCFAAPIFFHVVRYYWT